MTVCEKKCVKCNCICTLTDFLSNYRSYVHKTCRWCRYTTRKEWLFRKNNVQLTTCRGDFCPDASFFQNITLHQSLDGRTICLGCFRKKKRSGKNEATRKRIQEFCFAMTCKFCTITCDNVIDMNYFDLLDENDKVISYSRILRCKKQTRDDILSDGTRIACLNCVKDKVTSYIR